MKIFKGKLRTHIYPMQLYVMYILLIYSIVILAPRSCYGDVDFADILDEATVSIESLPMCALRTETRNSFSPDPEEIGAYDQIYDLRWDSDRIDVAKTRYREVAGETKAVFCSRHIWDGKKYLHRQKPIRDTAGPVWASVSFAPGRKQYSRNLLESPYLGGFLSGVFVGDDNDTISILKRSTAVVLRERMEDVNGAPCYVVESTSQYGKRKIWIDPSCGFNIRKTVINKGLGDIHFGEPITRDTSSGDRQFAGCQLQLDDVTIKKVDGKFLPVSGVLLYTLFFSDGSKDEQRWESKRTNIQLNPDFEKMGAFIMDGIPNGAFVEHEDFPGIRYIWNGSRAVIDVGLDVLEIANDIDNTFKQDDIGLEHNSLRDTEKKEVNLTEEDIIITPSETSTPVSVTTPTINNELKNILKHNETETQAVRNIIWLIVCGLITAFVLCTIVIFRRRQQTHFE